jgi:hypothetical protein
LARLWTKPSKLTRIEGNKVRLSRFNVVRRVYSWRDNIAAAVVALRTDVDALRIQVASGGLKIEDTQPVQQGDSLAQRLSGLQSILEKHESVISDLELKLVAFDGAAASLGGGNIEELADVRGALDAEILDRKALHVSVRQLNRQSDTLASAIAEETIARSAEATDLGARIGNVEADLLVGLKLIGDELAGRSDFESALASLVAEFGAFKEVAVTGFANHDSAERIRLIEEKIDGAQAQMASSLAAVEEWRAWALGQLSAAMQQSVLNQEVLQQTIAVEREAIEARLTGLAAAQRESAVVQHAFEQRLECGIAEIAARMEAVEDVSRAYSIIESHNTSLSQAQDESAIRLSSIEQGLAADRADLDARLAEVMAVQQENAARQAAILSQFEAINEQLAARSAEADSRHADILARHDQINHQHAALAAEAGYLMGAMSEGLGPAGKLLSQAADLYINQHGSTAVIVAAQVKFEEPLYQSGDVSEIVAAVASGKLSLLITADPPADGIPSVQAAGDLLPLFRNTPGFVEAAFKRAEAPQLAKTPEDFHRRAQDRLRINPHVIGALAESHRASFGAYPTPLDSQRELPALPFAQAKRRSALFLHNSYYHFNVLADGLRKRGWDALTVSIESPTSPQRQFFHGEDVNLHDPDFNVMRAKVREFFKTVPERFGAMHFYGQGQASFFPEHYENRSHPTKVAWDFFELRRHRMKIGYMPTGCLDGARQSDIRRITGGLCRSCVWENEPAVCSDARSAAWADRLEALCDWVGIEGDWAVGVRTGAKYVRGPVVTTLDPSVWYPGIGVSQQMNLPRHHPDEVLVYHAVGNYEQRQKGDRDIKGSGAVLRAIETLQREGLPVRLVFFSDVLSTEIKNYQVQADIVIDQLRYGRYGANARECMMLGRPVIGRIDGKQEGSDAIHRMFEEAPIIDASVDTITDVLRNLVKDATERARLGRASREFALRWHGMEVCAERYERVIDRLRDGLAPDSADLYPSRRTIDVANIDQFAAEAATSRSRRAPAE